MMHKFNLGRDSFVCTSFLLLMLSAGAKAGEKMDQLYLKFCASCHGASLEGGLGGSLIDSTWAYGGTAEAIAKSIASGIPDKGMPAWKPTLSDEQIRGLVIYIQEQGAAAAQGDLLKKTEVRGGKVSSQLHSFTIETISDGFDTLWAMDFLPDGKYLVTEKSGKLWLVAGKNKTEVSGIPKVWNSGQGGLLEVRRLANSDWIYLSFSKQQNGRAMTTIVRGKIKDNKWGSEETIFEAPMDTWINSSHHFGSRIIFKDDYVFFTIGDRGRMEMAQELNKPNGKVHRVHLNGKIPSDNPFVNTKNALPSIWSYGHRNPQGLTLSSNGRIWLTEHGPRGGDEINLIEKGNNYGWPTITYGMNYNGTPITDKTAAPGMEQPKYYWVPSIAITAVEEYRGDHFPKWRNQLLVGSLAKEELQRLTVDGEGNVIATETLLKNQGRIRDIRIDNKGHIYLVVNGRSDRAGRIIKLSAL